MSDQQEPSMGGVMMTFGFFIVATTGIVVGFSTSIAYGSLGIGIALFILGFILTRNTSS